MPQQLGVTKIYLALGSNLGDRMQNLRAALRQLAPHIALTHLSPIYQTEPWGVADQPDFFNMTVCGETALAPVELLDALQAIEKNMGRVKTVRYGPRVIDLDILMYGDTVMQTERLEIPHPRMAERRFVLVPLNDIAPHTMHPRLKRTVRELLSALQDDSAIRLHPETIRLDDVTQKQ